MCAVYLYVFLYACMYICILHVCVRVFLYVHALLHICMYVRVWCIRVCNVCVCKYACVIVNARVYFGCMWCEPACHLWVGGCYIVVGVIIVCMYGRICVCV